MVLGREPPEVHPLFLPVRGGTGVVSLSSAGLLEPLLTTF